MLALVLAQPAMAQDAGKLIEEKTAWVHSSKPVYSAGTRLYLADLAYAMRVA